MFRLKERQNRGCKSLQGESKRDLLGLKISNYKKWVSNYNNSFLFFFFNPWYLKYGNRGKGLNSSFQVSFKAPGEGLEIWTDPQAVPESISKQPNWTPTCPRFVISVFFLEINQDGFGCRKTGTCLQNEKDIRYKKRDVASYLAAQRRSPGRQTRQMDPSSLFRNGTRAFGGGQPALPSLRFGMADEWCADHRGTQRESLFSLEKVGGRWEGEEKERK